MKSSSSDDPAVASQERRGSIFARMFSSIPIWLAIGTLVALVSLWLTRLDLSPDGMVYLDMARGAIRLGPGHLLNACWGAILPALIALVLTVVRPSSLEATLIAVHLLNASLLIAALATFLVFVDRYALPQCEDRPRRALFLSLCAVFFLWAVTENTYGVKSIDPDLCVFILVVAVASLVVRLHGRSQSSWLVHIAIGIALGVGYYIRQAMLPIGGLLLVILFAFPPRVPRARARVAVSSLVFLLIVAPFVAWQSGKAGHFTVSENGRLNYLWHVENIPMVPYDAASYDAYLCAGPLRPPRVVVDHPVVFVFGNAAEGTYPWIYDPARWFEGIRPHFHLREQIQCIVDNLRGSAVFFLSFRAVWLGLLALMFVPSGGRRATATMPGRINLVLWCVGTCIGLHLVHVEPRYLLPLVCILLAIGCSAVAHKLQLPALCVIVLTVIGTLVIPSPADIFALKAVLRSRLSGERPPYFQIADELRGRGLKSGGSIAVAGFASDAFYAKALNVRIAAQIPDAEAFWRMSDADMGRVREALLRADVTFIVAPENPLGVSPPWGGGPEGKPYSIITLK
jgi:hypothetical protein